MIRTPFFLVGAERSGTTLLRLVLDHHPSIACHAEFSHSVDYVTDDGGFPDVATYATLVAKPYFHHFPDPVIDTSLPYPELVDSFLLQKQRSSGGKPIVGATVHRHFDRLLHLWPDALFVHLCRDGRDVARSCVAMGWDGNVYTAIDRWLEVENLWDRLSTRLPPERRIDVRYRTFVLDPAGTLTRVCSFLGVDFDEQMLKYHETTTYDLPDPAMVQQWRRKAARREIELIESKAADMLRRRGYELSGFPLVVYTARQKKRLERASAWARRLWRLRSIGPVLMLLDNVSRRLPIPGLRNHVDRRLDAIRARLIK